MSERPAEPNDALKGLVSPRIMEALALALDYRDKSTSGHSRRVATLTVRVATHHGVQGEALQQIEHGALLHDIGKLKIPDSILWKPRSLDEVEWVTMRTHQEYADDLIRDL